MMQPPSVPPETELTATELIDMALTDEEMLRATAGSAIKAVIRELSGTSRDEARPLLEELDNLINDIADTLPELFQVEGPVFLTLLEALQGINAARALRLAEQMFEALEAEKPPEKTVPLVGHTLLRMRIAEKGAWAAYQQKNPRVLRQWKGRHDAIQENARRIRDERVKKTDTSVEARMVRNTLRIAHFEGRLETARLAYRRGRTPEFLAQGETEEAVCEAAFDETRWLINEMKIAVEPQAGEDTEEFEALKNHPEMQRIYADALNHQAVMIAMQYLWRKKFRVGSMSLAQRTFGHSQEYRAELETANENRRAYIALSKPEGDERPSQKHLDAQWGLVVNLMVMQEYAAAIEAARRADDIATKLGDQEHDSQLKNIIGNCKILLAEKIATVQAAVEEHEWSEAPTTYYKNLLRQAESILIESIDEKTIEQARKTLLQQGIDECAKAANQSSNTRNVHLFRGARASVTEGVLQLCEVEGKKNERTRVLQYAHELYQGTGPQTLMAAAGKRGVRDQEWCFDEAPVVARLITQAHTERISLPDLPDRTTDDFRAALDALQQETATEKETVPRQYYDLARRNITWIHDYLTV